MLETKLRVLYLPGKHTITELNPKLLFCLIISSLLEKLKMISRSWTYSAYLVVLFPSCNKCVYYSRHSLLPMWQTPFAWRSKY